MIKVFGVSFFVVVACLLVSSQVDKRESHPYQRKLDTARTAPIRKKNYTSPTRVLKVHRSDAVPHAFPKPKPAGDQLNQLEQKSARVESNSPRKGLAPKRWAATRPNGAAERNLPINFPSSAPKKMMMNTNHASTSKRSLRSLNNRGMTAGHKMSF